MNAKAVVVKDESGVPVINAECTFVSDLSMEFPFPLTNKDGYTYPPPGISAQPGHIRVLATGFLPAIYPITLDSSNQEIHLGGDPNFGPSNTIHLPALQKSFKKPSRERILNVMANLCNIEDSTGLPIFEPFISTLYFENRLRASDWIARLKGSGSTHITVELSGDYDEYLSWLGSRYPIIGLDMMNRLDDFKRFLDWILNQNLIPIVKSGCDGQNYSESGKTYGWSWGMTNLPSIYEYLKDYKKLALWSTGYDGCFPDWSPNQILNFLKMMRQNLGIEACIDTEFGAGPGESISYCHLGNGAADWVDDKLGDLDSFSIELQTYPAQEEGMIEVFERIGPRGTYRHNDKTIVHMYETTAYWSIRKNVDKTQNQYVSKQAYSVGYRTFGNGLPL